MSVKRLMLSAVPHLPPSLGRLMVGEDNLWSLRDESDFARSGSGPRSLLVGPLNTAGQAKRWADAARLLPGVDSSSLGVRWTNGPLVFPADAQPSLNAFWRSPKWSKRQSQELLSGFSHVLIESATPLLGTLYGRDLEREVAALQEANVSAGLVWHGSDIRSPDRHRALQGDSPFFGSLDGLTESLEASTKANAEIADRLGLLEFVSTPDLLDYRPQATWIPTLHDRSVWDAAAEGRHPSETLTEETGRRKPVVVHIPSRSALKGSERIRKAVGRLSETIEYRELTGLRPEEVAHQVAESDIVIDQLGMGLYGIASVEAMAVGKPVVAEVGSAIRSRVGQSVPIVEANEASLADVILDLAKDEAKREQLGQAGLQYVQEVHSERRVASVLAGFLHQLN